MQSLLQLARLIDTMNDRIGRAVSWLAALMVLVGAFNAIARYLSRALGKDLSSNAYLEGQWYLFSIILLLGMAYTLRHDRHVRVDVIYGKLSERGKAWIDLLGTLLFLLPFSIVTLILTWPTVRNSWITREVSADPGGLPRYPLKTVILIGFGLLLLQGVSMLIRQIAFLRGDTAQRSEYPTGEGPGGHGEGV
ncbi:MAG: TRAP transporter small permease subunit [Candidatus Eisenbacteria bacterium]|uniref:TRAP transporter small permease subunit n=1 Tax=Eiseniibacteriota bacterium TaxID=2212470 RepID=A0A956NBK6_UNCEI|nr:TRAP transporter small permease subunit [Candidatus Eisenbacteria bacterium]MCB9464080.1 TRAP transporter small permease subunit [Candidatus Eisenbacteria bacterium]